MKPALTVATILLLAAPTIGADPIPVPTNGPAASETAALSEVGPFAGSILLVYTDPEGTRPTHALKDVVLQSIGGRQMLVGVALAADVAGPWRPGVKISLPWEDVLTYQELTPEEFARSSAGPELQSPSDSRSNRDPQTYGRDARSGSERDTRNGRRDVRNDRRDRDQRPARSEREQRSERGEQPERSQRQDRRDGYYGSGRDSRRAMSEQVSQPPRENPAPPGENPAPRSEDPAPRSENPARPGENTVLSPADTLPPPQGAEPSSLVTEPPRQEPETPAPKRRKHRENSWDKWNWRNY